MYTQNEKVEKVNVAVEMSRSFLDYSMSVIISRALPDARDGLKPSQRRILFAMHDLSLFPNRQHRKCAKICGDTSGNYHPHGEAVIYPTLVHMAQPWAMRERLVDGQGNFGSVEGDPPAAMRYTEAKMTHLGAALMQDMDKDTVDFVPNYDETRTEPTVFPAAFPNLLINGGTGIAVGMATNMPPHNLVEVIDGICAQIDDPEITLDGLMQFVKGPDFPTGCSLCGIAGIRQYFETGRGSLKIRGKAGVEELKGGREQIVVTEIPYNVNRATLVEKIADLVNDKIITDISAIRDESDENTRVVIELKRDAIPKVVINNLYKHTALESSFAVTMLAIDHGKPKLLSLKEAIQCYIEHRREVVIRRTKYELRKAEERAETLEGYLIALANLDQFIKIIRASSNREEARVKLLAFEFTRAQVEQIGIMIRSEARLTDGRYCFSEQQANQILELRLYQLTGNKYFKKIPRRIPYPVTVAFGAPIPPEKADINTVRETLLELGEFCYQQRPILRGHLGEACLRGLKHKQFDVAIIDGIDGRQITHGMLLAVAMALSRHIRKNFQNQRIGSVLPTSIGAVAANLAVMLAGKVPVNLNFTAGRDALESAIRIAELDTAITARAFMKRAPDFPFPKNVLLLDELIPQLRPWIVFWRAMVVLMPWWVLTRILGVPRTGDRKEAVVLFTSGSSGEPKGVVLSHRNLLGNVTQFSSMLNLDRHDSILASLPYFHSFGCTVTLWYPLIEGVKLVTNPNPVDVTKNAELIERHKITMLLATPTFLRSYIKRTDRSQLDSLKLIVTGAEKLPDDVVSAFREKFGKHVEQGYGLTETSPVVSVNLPEPPKFLPDDNIQPSSRLGSAGKLAPGLAAQIRDPETGATLTLRDTGMLWLRGVNIFEGYLNDPKRTAEVLVDGWFKTGDLGRFDQDGFLYIEGRLSRFSKIGGEMVPHETLESKIYTALEIPSEGDRAVAVVGIPDEAKGEALVLLSVPELSTQELRSKLLEAGVPPLWIPKSIKRVDKIPVLGSGKLDLKQCRDLAGSA